MAGLRPKISERDVKTNSERPNIVGLIQRLVQGRPRQQSQDSGVVVGEEEREGVRLLNPFHELIQRQGREVVVTTHSRCTGSINLIQKSAPVERCPRALAIVRSICDFELDYQRLFGQRHTDHGGGDCAICSHLYSHLLNNRKSLRRVPGASRFDFQVNKLRVAGVTSNIAIRANTPDVNAMETIEVEAKCSKRPPKQHTARGEMGFKVEVAQRWCKINSLL